MSTLRPLGAPRLALALLLCTAAAASGQSQQPQPARPSNAVFRGAGTTPRDTMALTLSLYGAHDDELRADETAGSQRLAGGGPFSGLDGSLTYTPRQRGRFSFDFRGDSSARYYTDQGQFVAAGQSVSAGTSTRLRRSLALTARGGASYIPYFAFNTLPDMIVSVDPEVPPRVHDNALTARRSLAYDAGLDLTHTPNDRTAFTMRYAARRTSLLDEDRTSLDMTASAAFARRLQRRLETRVTYVHRDSRFSANSPERPVRVDDVELALEKNWAHSPTRRTDVTITLGPSVVEQLGRRSTRLFGGVALSHPFGRSWGMRTVYRRGVTFLEGTGQPFLSNSAAFDIHGLLTRRLEASFSVGAVLGDLGLDVATAATAYDTYSASTRLRYALGSRFALYGEYLYNRSLYSADTGLPGIDRTGLRIGLNAYVPLMREPQPRDRR